MQPTTRARGDLELKARFLTSSVNTCSRDQAPSLLAIYRHRNRLRIDGRKLVADVFPIGVDVDDIRQVATDAQSLKQVQAMVRSLSGRELIIGVDRLDYGKGLIQRTRAYERLLEKYPDTRRKPLMGFFRNAAVASVTPVRDGMNLVAKEYVAAQDLDDPGMLVLSNLAGAARELTDAIIVNPHDHDDVADGVATALNMPRKERCERHSAMLNVLRQNDIAAWRTRFVNELMTC